jgi:hypothetical protein
MRAIARTVIGLSVAALAACSTEPPPSVGGGEVPQVGVSEAELATLLAPEPGAAAAEYEASTSRYRLFGVQLSEVRSESSATLADTSTWETRTLRVGELLGRNLRLTAITPEGVELRGPGELRRLAVGQDASLRLIRHRFDKAAVHQGRNHWKVDGEAVGGIRGRYGLGAQAEPVNVFLEPAIRLSHVQESGLLARLGFQEGDLLLSMEGKPLSPEDLGALADRLLTPGSKVRLRVFRENAFQELTFSVPGTAEAPTHPR